MHGCLSPVCVCVCVCFVSCKAEVSASRLSLIPMRPSDSDVSEYDSGTSTMGGLGLLWLSRHGRRKDTHTISWHRCAVMPSTCDPQYKMCYNQFLVVLSVKWFSVSVKHELKKKRHCPALSHFRVFHFFPNYPLNFTALQAGRSRFRFPLVSLEFFIDIILQAALWLWGWLSL